MGIYERWLLPKILDAVCGTQLVGVQRAKVVGRAFGVVLEPGIGGGLNLPFYDPATVSKVVGVDPSIELGNKARKRAAGLPFPLELHSMSGALDAVPPGSVDSVVFTYTLCTVPDPAAVLAAARRALKPDGRLLFCEHALAPDARVQTWQRRLEPAWRALAGGCHLTRSAASDIRAAGFQLDELEQSYVAESPRFVGYHQIGSARLA